MTVPSLALGFIISSILGLLLHLLRGGGPGKILLYLIAAWAGFWGGHALGNRWDFTIYSLGPLNLGMASVGCFIGLFIGYWLGRVDFSEVE